MCILIYNITKKLRIYFFAWPIYYFQYNCIYVYISMYSIVAKELVSQFMSLYMFMNVVFLFYHDIFMKSLLLHIFLFSNKRESCHFWFC